jgi:hypothetical protein
MRLRAHSPISIQKGRDRDAGKFPYDYRGMSMRPGRRVTGGESPSGLPLALNRRSQSNCTTATRVGCPASASGLPQNGPKEAREAQPRASDSRPAEGSHEAAFACTRQLMPEDCFPARRRSPRTSDWPCGAVSKQVSRLVPVRLFQQATTCNGRAAPRVSEDLAQVPVNVRYRSGFPDVSGGVPLARRLHLPAVWEPELI